MKLFGLTVGRNEAHRYLASMIDNLAEVVDEHFYYDDKSDDDSLEIARNHGCHVQRRGPDPSFLEHEGKFRQGAWMAFEDALHPRIGDWVLVVDCDEAFISVGTNCCLRCETDEAIGAAMAQGAVSVCIPIPEVFGFNEDGVPLIRKDGYWGELKGTRLFTFRPNGVFPTYRDKPMGCGAEPTYVAQGRIAERCFGLHLLHYGYADLADRQAKYERYSSLANHGHNDSHIESILANPRLEPWDGPVPDMKRGVHA